MCFISRLFIYSMFYSFVHLSINGHGSVASWRSSRADVFFWSPEYSVSISTHLYSIQYVYCIEYTFIQPLLLLEQRAGIWASLQIRSLGINTTVTK